MNNLISFLFKEINLGQKVYLQNNEVNSDTINKSRIMNNK